MSVASFLKADRPSPNVLRLALNRPEKLNALSVAAILELADAIDRAAEDGDVHVVLLTGTGKAFSAGADIKEFIATDGAAYSDKGRLDAWRRIETFPKPLIAAVNGYALGGGLELVLLCDIVIAAETARFGTPEIDVASFPGDGGTQRLPRIVGRSFAMKMVLTGQMIDAAEAERRGLAAEIVPDESLQDRAIEVATTIARKPAAVAAYAKQAVRAAEELPLSQGLLLERRLVVEAFDLPDRAEGLAAFAAKRPPVFNHAASDAG
jgi:enoyl-CoA hydratase/carnithine racemase